MKPNPFKHSLIAVGVTAALGLSTHAVATNTTSGTTTNIIDIENVAVASYDVAGVEQPEVVSNKVIVRVSEQLSFSLLAQNNDGDQSDNVNNGGDVAPSGIIPFEHRLKNTGNRKDTYTLNLSNVETGDDAQYDVDNSTVTYQGYNADGTPITDPAYSGTDVLVSTWNNQSIPLEAGQYIDITINAKTLGNKGGNTQDLTLTATSSLLPDANKTLTNVDKSATTLPTFSIVKTVTNALDLNDSNDTATYQIVIKNPSTDYSADATDVTITDDLPAGLLIATALTTNSITTSGSATKGTLNQTDKGFELTGVNIPENDSITINFTVKKDPNAALANNALNHVKVTDDLDNNAATDNTLIDSTDSSVENVGDFYTVNDTDFTDGTNATGNDGNDSTQPLATIKRELELSNPTIKEIAPTSGTAGQVTHQTIITNKGQNVEGDSTNPLVLTITDGSNDAVNPVLSEFFLIYTPVDGTSSQPISVTPTEAGGVYTITSDQFPGGAGLNPGDKVEVRYNMASTSAVVGSEETTVVELSAGGEGAPTNIDSVTDTTLVRGVTLVKSQARDDTCDGTADTAFSSSADPLAATPGQCVIYQILATNTSSTERGFNIQNLVISDATSNFSATANYRGDDLASTTSTGTGTIITDQAARTEDENFIKSTIDPLVPQGTATMTFSVQIKTDR
ncbi:hypothetical protein [uncultured Psychrobacter sp.]|uniref:hypothetical protein n=1 Tax=uncultured Psychrobacter sp. TaxID=259303 RepID=UPI002629A6B3|nr:hypothetical protein [uncultured Psychrobacter sp.]